MHRHPAQHWIIAGVVAVALLLGVGLPLGLVAPIVLLLIVCPLVMGMLMFAMMRDTSGPGQEHQAPPLPSSVAAARPTDTTSANRA